MALKRKTSSGKARTIPVGIAFGLLVSLTVTLAGAVLLAYLIAAEKLGADGIGYGSMVILMAASALGTWSAVARIKRRRLMVCGISAAGYYLLLLGMTALFFGGQYEGMGVTALMVLIGSGIVLLLGMVGKKGSNHSRKIPAYR
ncbi:MAG: TIGR04086 family membrane protein [Oscillospiraceae bacterium]|nr:TIGR04086 family membrane protein [Oscillospiraceae bacterium]